MECLVNVQDDTNGRKYLGITIKLSEGAVEELQEQVKQELIRTRRWSDDKELELKEATFEFRVGYARPEMPEEVKNFLRKLHGVLKEKGISFVDTDIFDPDAVPEDEIAPDVLKAVEEALIGGGSEQQDEPHDQPQKA